MPWKTFKEGDKWEVWTVNEDGGKGEKVAEHDTEEQAEDQVKALYANVKETAGASPAPESIAEIFAGGEVITEFRGNVPDVPFIPGFDLEGLKRDDPNPFFLTLEISREGRVSKNGLMHDARLGDMLVEQINSRAITGIMGHLDDKQRQTAYPLPTGYVVGGVKRGEATYGKFYIPKTKEDEREHYRMLMRMNGKAATSMYGSGVKEYDDKTRGVWRLKDLNLEQIDFAPFERAALPPESDFAITAEMATGGEAMPVAELEPETPITEVTSEMEKNEMIAELTANDTGLLPDAVKAAIVAEYEAQAQTKNRIAELEGNLTTTTARVAEVEAERDGLKAQIAEFEKARFEADVVSKIAELLDWPVNDDEGKGKIESLRKNMRRAVLAEMAAHKADELDAVVTELWDGEFKSLAETMRDALAGPAAIVGGQAKPNGVIAELEAKYADPKARAEAAARLGF